MPHDPDDQKSKKRHLAVVQDPWNLKFQVGAAGDGQDRRLQAPVKKRRSEKYSAESACKPAPTM
jgi:hypothetical protein